MPFYIDQNGRFLDRNKFPVVRGGSSFLYKKGNDSPPDITPGQNQVQIQVTTSTTPYSIDVSFADLKYNKQSVFNFEMDDRSAGAMDVMAYLKGGTASNSVTYPGKTFTDGCGNNIKYVAAVACNAKTNGSAEFPPADTGFAGQLTWTQIKTLIQAGFTVENHGYFHDKTAYGYTNDGYDEFQNINDNTSYIYDQLDALGVEFLTRVWVTPNADLNYNPEVDSLGYLAATSQSVTDGYTSVAALDTIPTTPDFRVYLRDFNDAWDVSDTNNDDDRAYVKSRIDTLIAGSSSSVHKMYRVGSHTYLADWFSGIRDMFDYLQTNSGDTIWVTTLQEMLEYIEAKNSIIKTITTSGIIATITLDFSNIPANNRYRDITVLINPVGATITNISVDGEYDDFSTNVTGIVNIFKKKTTGFVLPTPVRNSIIPLSASDFLQDNNAGSAAGWVDGTLTTEWVPSFQLFYDHEILIDLRKERGVILNKLEIYDSFGGLSGFTATEFYAVDRKDGTETLIASYTGANNNDTWTSYTLSSIRTDLIKVRPQAINNSVKGDGGFYGTEIRLTGNYVDNTRPTYVRTKVPLKNMFGVNGFWWDIAQDDTNGDKSAIYTPKTNRYLEAGVSGFRLYSTITNIELVKDNWAFNPTISGWKTDLVSSWLKDPNGDSSLSDRMNCLFNLIDVPPYLTNDWRINNRATSQATTSTTSVTIPSSQGTVINITVGAGKTYVNGNDLIMWDPTTKSSIRIGVTSYNSSTGALSGTSFETFGSGTFSSWNVDYTGTPINVPILYTDRNNKKVAASYAHIARAAFITAGRYGSNTSISSTLMQTPMPANGFQGANTVQVGLNTMTEIEVGNELEPTWAGKDTYMNGQMLAAYSSALYDGHKGTIDYGLGAGIGVGVKNADPNMKLVLAGLAVSKVDTLRGFYEWCIVNRGYKSNGQVDLPIDKINFHRYPSNGGQFGATCAMPLELTTDVDNLKDMLFYSNYYFGGIEVVNTEWGYDFHTESVLGTNTVGAYTREQVAGIWAVRWMLLMSQYGLDAAYWFKTYCNNISSSTQFDTMGMWHDEHVESGSSTPTYERRPIADLWSQLKAYQSYYPDGIVEDSSVKCVRFKKITGEIIYAVWGVETTTSTTGTKNVPGSGNQTVSFYNFTETAGTYHLSLPDNPSVIIKQLQFGTTAMTSSSQVVTGGSLPVSYGAKPVIIEIL